MPVMTKDASGKTLFLGINSRNWGIIVGGLLFLYICLGLLYASLITIAVECRGEEYIKMPKEFFGDFSREKYYAHFGSPTEDDQFEVYPWILTSPGSDCEENLLSTPDEKEGYYSCDPTCEHLIYHPICDDKRCMDMPKQCLNP
eukprot:4313720-Pyramimonas_sp.AAC.1